MRPSKNRNFSIKLKGHEVRVLDFIQNFLYIRPKKQSEEDIEEAPLVLFKLNPQQMELYKKIEDDWCNYRPIRYVILKARQIGFSTLIAAIIFTLTLYDPYKESLIVADIDDHTSRIFEMYQRFYDNLPPALKPKLVSNKRGSKLTTSAGSTIGVETVSEDIARGSTLKCVHASEYGVWRKQKEALATLTAAVPYSANTLFFIESTARGINYFREVFNKAYNGSSRLFNGHFATWYKNAGYRVPYENEELFSGGEYDNEAKLYQEYKDDGMTLEGLMWRRTQIDAMGLDLFHQEYPTYPDEAFLSTGVSVFNTQAVHKRMEEVRHEHYVAKGYFTYNKQVSSDGRRISVTNITLHNDSNGSLTIYEKPYPGYPYVVGGDPAGSSGKDYFVGQVLRHDGNCRKQVAIFRQQKMDAEEYALQMYCLGTYYNTALIGIEINSFGFEPNKVLAKTNYRKIYVRQNQQSYEENALSQYGVSTQGTNKEDMVNHLKARFRERPEEITDITTLIEMETFVVLDIGSRGNYIMGAATPSDHDDTVMALVIAHNIAESTQQTTYVNREVNRSAVMPFELRETQTNKNQIGGGLWKKHTIS